MKTGHILSNVEFVKVKQVRRGSIDVENVDTGMPFQINGQTLIDSMTSADEFSKTEKEPLTSIAERLSGAKNVAFTVNFKMKNGKERTLRGRLIKPEPILGRSMVHDFDVVSGSPIRLVDHRTINWLILNGIKYVVK